MSKSKHFMTIDANPPTDMGIVYMTIPKGAIQLPQSNPMSDYYRSLGFESVQPTAILLKHPLDDMVRSCTAFTDMDDMVHSMTENDYVPTLSPEDPDADRLARELQALGFRVWPER